MSIVPSTNSCVARLIDANLDRAREGLRVVEDWCRFGLQQKNLVVTLKDWRQQLGNHHHEIYKNARATSQDKGIGLTHPAQKNRHSPEEVVAANCSRVQEALRVLEEFSRITDPDLANNASKIRYGLYELELKILKATITSKLRKKLEHSKLCLITTPQPDLSKRVASALEQGVDMVQYRSKEDTDRERVIQARELACLCKKHKALFIVNDRLDLALAVDADGVHLGQNDIPTDIARRLLGKEKLIGRSTHCIKELQEAEQEGCDYLGVGPVFSTQTKPRLRPSGISYVKEASQATQLPWFAIGGINCSNIDKVLNAGAKKIAIAGAIMNSTNPTSMSLELIQKIS
ncbi:thiamine phosphate synthase [Prochlorococcus sp. MIT 1307]|uniref:thiamine phosphate synthase n=1 Tax=Prochlorococcus sp. MIT 1307 TaxID=3096219 RepID=UPI002A74AF88|nr:thiamine phosphate synthase [Prochlorococcus sp. MIT 1307]